MFDYSIYMRGPECRKKKKRNRLMITKDREGGRPGEWVKGFLFRAMKMFWNYTAMVAAQCYK